MKTRIFGLGILVLVLGCQSTGGSAPESRGGPIAEVPDDDPGMPGRSGLSRGGGEMQLVTIYFTFDDASLRSDAKRGLKKNATQLRDSGSRIEIQGHCDERGTEEYNLALGQRRAEAARRYLVDLGVGSAKVETKSFGESMPAVRGHDESAWAKNRRDEFVVVR